MDKYPAGLWRLKGEQEGQRYFSVKLGGECTAHWAKEDVSGALSGVKEGGTRELSSCSKDTGATISLLISMEML